MPSIYRRWGIEQSDDEKQQIFQNRLKLLMDNLGTLLTSSEVAALAFARGKSKNEVADYDQWNGRWHIDTSEILSTRNPFILAVIIESLMKCVSQFHNDPGASKLRDFINKSECGIRIARDGGEWITYPAGEKLLDVELVERPLSVLTGKASNEFIKSLEHFKSGNWVESAEKSRRTLEEYLRYKLSRPNVGLSGAIKQLCQQLKDVGTMPEHLRLLINKHLNMLDSHYNDSSKHNSVTGEDEAEFLIYQTGITVKLLESIKL